MINQFDGVSKLHYQEYKFIMEEVVAMYINKTINFYNSQYSGHCLDQCGYT